MEFESDVLSNWYNLYMNSIGKGLNFLSRTAWIERKEGKTTSIFRFREPLPFENQVVHPVQIYSQSQDFFI